MIRLDIFKILPEKSYLHFGVPRVLLPLQDTFWQKRGSFKQEIWEASILQTKNASKQSIQSRSTINLIKWMCTKISIKCARKTVCKPFEIFSKCIHFERRVFAIFDQKILNFLSFPHRNLIHSPKHFSVSKTLFRNSIWNIYLGILVYTVEPIKILSIILRT